jgi:hypothetical protein
MEHTMNNLKKIAPDVKCHSTHNESMRAVNPTDTKAMKDACQEPRKVSAKDSSPSAKSLMKYSKEDLAIKAKLQEMVWTDSTCFSTFSACSHTCIA